jgi:hypothetical protein
MFSYDFSGLFVHAWSRGERSDIVSVVLISLSMLPTRAVAEEGVMSPAALR